jgi:hypothetical protein
MKSEEIHLHITWDLIISCRITTLIHSFSGASDISPNEGHLGLCTALYNGSCLMFLPNVRINPLHYGVNIQTSLFQQHIYDMIYIC